ncbi:MAG: ABC transporter transmembrane domain-containing protein [Caldilineaceae bacterium]
MMLIINWRLALLAMVILPIVTIVTVYFRKRIRRSSQSERTAMGALAPFSTNICMA